MLTGGSSCGANGLGIGSGDKRGDSESGCGEPGSNSTRIDAKNGRAVSADPHTMGSGKR